jgi:hypothetical protein
MSNDFAGMEGYRLQPQKSVSIQIKPKSTKMASAPVEYTQLHLRHLHAYSG